MFNRFNRILVSHYIFTAYSHLFHVGLFFVCLSVLFLFLRLFFIHLLKRWKLVFDLASLLNLEELLQWRRNETDGFQGDDDIKENT